MSGKDEQDKEQRALRNKQLRKIRAAINRLGEAVDTASDAIKRREALLSHLRTFYLEMSQIAKGKGVVLVPVAELMVTQINNAIADAKQLISDDIYLDRVKQFVSAGDPPTYSEVLLVTKTVEEVLNRHAAEFKDRSNAISRKLKEAWTIESGIECSIDDLENVVLRESVEERMDGPDANWFFEDQDGEELFDLERLDNLDLDAHFATVEEDGSGQDEEDDAGSDEDE